MDFIAIVLREIEECITEVSDLFAAINKELQICIARINKEVSYQFNQFTIDIERNTLKVAENQIISKLNVIHMLHSQLRSLILVKGLLEFNTGYEQQI